MQDRSAEPSGLVSLATRDTCIPLDPLRRRLSRMRRGVMSAARFVQEAFQSSRFRYRTAFITLTYRPGAPWDAGDIRGGCEALPSMGSTTRRQTRHRLGGRVAHWWRQYTDTPLSFGYLRSAWPDAADAGQARLVAQRDVELQMGVQAGGLSRQVRIEGVYRVVVAKGGTALGCERTQRRCSCGGFIRTCATVVKGVCEPGPSFEAVGWRLVAQ